MKVLSPLQRQLLEGITASKVKSEVSVPPVKVMSSESNSDTPRDESTLTYEELLEDFVKFDKSAVMKPETFDRLWNS
jgi:hypothetical protein